MESEGKMARIEKNILQAKRKDERLGESWTLVRNEIRKDEMELKYCGLKISHTRSEHFCVNITSLGVF